MRVINIGEFETAFIIYFGGERKRINAYTLASTLVSIADAVKAANSLINPGYDVEVVVEAFGEGSFKSKVRTLYNGASNLFSSDNLKTIAVGVIAAYVYEHTLAPNQEVNVIVNTDEVVVEQGDNRVIVPREIHDCVKVVEKSEKFVQSIAKAFEALEKDQDIESIGFTPNLGDQPPLLSIPRAQFALLSTPPSIEDNDY